MLIFLFFISILICIDCEKEREIHIVFSLYSQNSTNFSSRVRLYDRKEINHSLLLLFLCGFNWLLWRMEAKCGDHHKSLLFQFVDFAYWSNYIENAFKNYANFQRLRRECVLCMYWWQNVDLSTKKEKKWPTINTPLRIDAIVMHDVPESFSI